ncbi:MAG: hypothetical protein AB2392_21385 [Neobacillus sp.]
MRVIDLIEALKTIEEPERAEIVIKDTSGGFREKLIILRIY